MTLFCTAAVFVLLQAAPQSTQAQQPPKASIEGFVLRAGTNEPVAGARVTVVGTTGTFLQPSNNSPIPPVMTNDKGHYLVKDLEAGSYNVIAQRNGFTRQLFGERAPGRGGNPVNLITGQAITDVIFRLIPAGAVSGRVSDATGEPLSNINVQLLQSKYDAGGHRTFTPAGTARTDDRGEYRIYWMTPGRYFVSAAPALDRLAIGSLNLSTNEVAEPGYALTYYPGTADPSTASAIDLPPGGELNTIDFTLSRQLLYRVRGRIFHARTGQSPPSAIVHLNRADTLAISGSALNNYTGANGTFELRDIANGAYWLIVQSADTPTVPGQPLGIAAQVRVDVSNNDVDNLAIALAPGLTIPGRISIDGGAPVSSLPNLDRIRAFLAPVQQGTVALFSTSPVSADGTFKADNVQPGDYRLTVSPLPPGYYVKEARLGQTDILSGLSISGAVSESLEAVVSPNAGQVEGDIRDKDRNPIRGIQAVLIPERQRDRLDLYRTAVSDQTGHFVLRSIVPGDYKLFVWEDIEPYAYNDPEVLRKYEERGTLVKVSESSKLTVEAKMIPAGQ